MPFVHHECFQKISGEISSTACTTTTCDRQDYPMKNSYLLLVGIGMILTTLLVSCTNPAGQPNGDPSIKSDNELDTTADNMRTYFPPTPGNEWIFRRVFNKQIFDMTQSGQGNTWEQHLGIYRVTVSENGLMHCEAVDSVYTVDDITEAKTLIEIKNTSYSINMPLTAAEMEPDNTFSSLDGVSYDKMSTITSIVNDSLQYLKYYHFGGSAGVWTSIYLRNVGPIYLEESSGSHGWIIGLNSSKIFYLISFNGIPYDGEEIYRQVLEDINW